MAEQPIDPLGKVTESKDLLGKIRGFLSGFVGYVERDQRREADKLLREAVAERFEKEWGRVSAVQRQLVAEKQLEYIDDLEAAAIKLRAFIDRVKGAAYGYAGFFDHVRIGDEELAKLYEHDLGLLQGADRIEHAVDLVQEAIGSDGLAASIRNLTDLSQELVDIFDQRDQLMLSE